MENKTKTKNLRKIYRNALAVYLNAATDNVEKCLSVTSEEKKDALQKLRECSNDANKEKYWEAARNNIFFIGWMTSKHKCFIPDNTEGKTKEQILHENWEILLAWLGILFDLRNYWSHTEHNKIVLPDNINEALIDLYVQACMESGINIPEKYKAENGLNIIVKDKESYEVKEITKELSFTGTMFFCCLFLEGRQISDFLEAMELSIYSFDELNERYEHRLNQEEYPENLRRKPKHFLYARDVYNYWKIRGHRSNIIEDHSLDEQEAYYAMLEYLKRCPLEYLELENPEKNEKKQVRVDGQDYDIREKNKFMEWGLEFWDEEMKRLGLTKWKWAKHQSADEKQKTREELEQKAKENGRPYKFPRYKKVIFDEPEDEEERINYRGDEHGFTYFLIKDDTETAAQAMFRYEQTNTRQVVGLMGSRMLCSVLEYYFANYPVTDKSEETDKKRKTFWGSLSNACFQHIESTHKNTESKPDITKEQVAKRIEFLQQQYDKATEKKIIKTKEGKEVEVPFFTSHQKIRFILDTWNQALTRGQKTNLEHAADDGNRLGGKNGYQKLLSCLSLMDNSLEIKREKAHNELIRILTSLGSGKTGKTYLSVLNEDMGIDLGDYDSLDALLERCIKYRNSILNVFRAKLEKEFDIKDWRPRIEMRWLDLHDGRTRRASQQTSPPKESVPEPTHIINGDHKDYAATGLPRNIRHLEKFKNSVDSEYLEKTHEKIYPSPNKCELLIPDFFKTGNGEELNTIRGNQHVRKRLFLIRRQDTVLSHIAYKRGVEFMGKELEAIRLKENDYQTKEMLLPIKNNETDEPILKIRFYYRYYRQNRYQLPAKLTLQIAQLLVSRELVEPGGIVPFNRLEPVAKSKMNFAERLALLSKEEQKLPFDEKQALINERFARVNNIVLKPNNNLSGFCFDELLQGYTIRRWEIMEEIHKLEDKVIGEYKLSPNEKGYIEFNSICDTLEADAKINAEEKAMLRDVRNAAFHGKLPKDKYMPDKEHIKQTVKEKKEKYYLDYFGYGVKLVSDILKRI